MPTSTSTSASVNGAAVSSTINPDAYMIVNSRQRQQNIRALDLLQSTFVNETKEQQFLDLGCGPGDFTCRHLLPSCPPLAKIVAVDVSLDMVEYAKKHFSHPKICYDVLDIAGNGMADFIRGYGRFDRVYSFFCLNWTNDQDTAFKNIAELLKPGGGCLLLFRASGNLMRLNKKMAAMNHWQKYRKVFENTIPPSADLVHRDALLSYISGLLKNADLTPTTCEVLEEKDVYSSAEEVTRLFTDLSSHSTLVTNEEKLLLHKEVVEEVARLWADQEAGVAPFRSTVFLVRAQKPRP